MGKYREIMQEFTLNNIPDLDVCVLAALELCSEKKIPSIKIKFKRPLVVGSGNAAATGKIMFEDKDAVFADESSFEHKLKTIEAIDGVVLLSASGGKHAPLIAKVSKRHKKKVILITNNPNAEAGRHADTTYVFPKNREPYTYNTSTYMGMMLSHTKEDPQKIIRFLEKLDSLTVPHFSKFKKYYLIVPPKFQGIIRLLNIKFVELFGRNIARDIETTEQVKHANTVVPSQNELFISFGIKNKTYGKDRLHIPLPANADYVTMMAVGYYIIGKIQKAQPAWFKRNIAHYTKEMSKIFKSNINPIVD